MHDAKDHRLLNEGLYGSLSGASAHEPAFLEVLQNEIYMSSMKKAINFDLGATSFYDRILAALTTIASRTMGMTAHVVLVNARTLKEAKIRLKTSLGISESWYQHCKAYPSTAQGRDLAIGPTSGASCVLHYLTRFKNALLVLLMIVPSASTTSTPTHSPQRPSSPTKWHQRRKNGMIAYGPPVAH